MLVGLGIRSENGPRDTNPQPREGELDVNGDVIPENDAWGTHGEELPNLEDLDPMNGNGNGSGPRGGPNEEPAPEASAARVGMAAGAGGVSKETPISQYPSLSYGLQETHTTIIPWRTWCSVANLDHGVPAVLELRMNAIWDMMVTETAPLTSGSTAAAKAFYVLPLGPGSTHTAGATFPITIIDGANALERPQWRNYWAQLYDYYTVLGCEYKVVIQATGNTRGANIVIGQEWDTYSDAATSTGNVMPRTILAEALAFKNIRWYEVDNNSSEANESNNVQVIRGTYKPGQAARNITNDGDVKTWTATGS